MVSNNNTKSHSGTGMAGADNAYPTGGRLPPLPHPRPIQSSAVLSHAQPPWLRRNCIQLTPLLITRLLPSLALIEGKAQTHRLPSSVMMF